MTSIYLNDKLYQKDLTVYSEVGGTLTKEDPDDFYASRVVCTNLLSPRFERYDQNNPIIPKKSSIYLSPGCPYSLSDVRKNYTIKRIADTADYNVFCSLPSLSYNTRKYAYAYIFSGECKLLFVFLDYRRPADSKAVAQLSREYLLNVFKQYIPNIPEAKDFVEETAIVDKNEAFYRKADIPEIYQKLLEGKFTKPCKTHYSLDLSTGMAPTKEMLDLIIAVGQKQQSPENFRALELELSALTQYDWRLYPGTMYLIFSELLSHSSNWLSIDRRYNRFSKGLRFFLENRAKQVPYGIWGEDYKMCKLLIDDALHLDGRKFVTTEDLIRNLNNVHISLEMFSKVYNNIVKIEAKK